MSEMNGKTEVKGTMPAIVTIENSEVDVYTVGYMCRDQIALDTENLLMYTWLSIKPTVSVYIGSKHTEVSF